MKLSRTMDASHLGHLSWLSLLMVLGLMTLGCRPAPEEPSRIVTDDLGYRVQIKRDVQKVVSLVPTNSELVCLLDCERLRGGTRYDRFPKVLAKRIKDKQVRIVGGGFDPNLEIIIEIGPDLILANGPSQQKAVLPLRKLGYPVISLYAQNIEWLKKDFLLLGEILGRQGKAKMIVEAEERGLKEIRRKTEGRKKKRVYLQTWANPMITVGKGSFSQSLLTLAGGINIFEDMPFDSGQVSTEWIIQRNPEVMIFTNDQIDFINKIKKRPEWNRIDAVKNNHICLIHEINFRRRIQFLDGIKIIHQCLFEGQDNGKVLRLDSSP